MKRLIKVIFTLFLIFNCNAQNKLDSTLVHQYESRLDSLENVISKLQAQNDNDKLVDEYRNLISLFGIGFGVLLGLFGLVFPLILYVVQIRPTHETIKETKNLLKRIDEDFETSFKEHFRKSRIKLVDDAIDNYFSKNIPMLSSSHSTIDTYKNEGFTELQVVRLIKLLKGDSDEKDFFARMLIFQEDENTEDYFVELIKNDPKDKNCIWGALYFATYNKQEYIDLIAKIVVNGYSLTGMISSLCSTSKDFAILLLNNELLLKELDKKERENYRDYGFKHFVEKTNKEIAESTLFWKKYGNKE